MHISKKPPISIGLVCSQAGPYQMMGTEMLKSAMLAIGEVNESDAFDFTLVPHVRDPKGVIESYHAACADLIRSPGVEHIVGCYTSASRKQVLPIIERTDRLLWYPARYEGFECSDNVIYVGAAPNHNVVPLVRYMLEHLADCAFCIGSNYIWTWETNRVIREIVSAAGGQILAERMLDLGETSVAHIVDEIVARRPPVVFNTLVGQSSYLFMRAFHDAATRAGLAVPVLSCSLCEPELKLIGADASVGCVTSSGYFASIDRPENHAFVARWKARYGADSSPSVDGQYTYVAVMLLARAIRRGGATDVATVRSAAGNLRYEAPQGPVWVDPGNNHCVATPRLARSVQGFQFEIFWEAAQPERADPYLSDLDLSAIAREPASSQRTATMRRPSYLRVVK